MSESALRATAIDHVVLHVGNVTASVAFYTDVLGMRIASQGPRHAFLDCGEGGQRIGLFADDGAADRRDVNHLAFTVAASGRDAVRAALEARGVAVRGRRGDPDCIYFDDPDGYTLQIVLSP